jgi:DMSO/TMAO reductase YedYZ molybdopterin-dependent catalytic subunit
MRERTRQVHQDVLGFCRFWLGFVLALSLLLFPASIPSAYAQKGTTQRSENAASSTPAEDASSACEPAPIVVPTLPEKIPGYTELDPDTQLHVTGTAKVIDLESYRLEITGKVKQSLSLTYDELRCMPKMEARPILICPGFLRIRRPGPECR